MIGYIVKKKLLQVKLGIFFVDMCRGVVYLYV